ncbi:MAG TPA: SusC/RagA family TonB-linked outer membrane protein, partial [Chitinophagaceae bacterium]|nr:SusC/RagA family TonB-linked outer membrane protein [Chitinophagaceae bacterium]
MTIRGENTITGVTEPLVVIDGVIGGRIRDINPADILTIDVLKDASSTAIYGSRGANGVVIITTKKGSKGKPQLSIDSYIGSKNPAHLPKFQTAQQFYKMTYTDRINDGGSPILFTANELNVINSGQSTDWIDLMTKNSLQMGHTVSVTGGSDNTTYRFSGGYIQEDGSIPHNTYKKYTLNGAMESKVNSFLKVGFNVFFNYSENPTGSFEALRSAYRARPTGVAYYDQLVNPADGYDATIEPFDGLAVWMGIKDSQVMNPLIEADPSNYQFQINARNQMGNAYAEITLLKGLTFRSSISGSLIAEKQGEFRGTYTKDRAGTKLPRSFYDTRDLLTYTIDNLLTYNKSFNKHKLTVTALQSAYKNVAEAYHIAVEDLPFASLWYNVGTAGTISGVSSNYERNTLQSYMGRVNYSFNDKYLLTLTGRSDGASQLSNGNKWAFFPSAAVAWRVSDESFMSSVNAVSDLKLRVSYGQVGNATVSPYSTQAAILNTPYDFGGNAAFGFAPSNLGNKDLKWERSEELNFGLDMGFLQNRIRATVEVYDRKTRDLILNTQLPTSTGFTSVYANVGKVGNKGIEVALNTVNIQTKDFSWSTALTFAKNNNKILALASGVTEDVGNKLFVGSSVRSNYYYQFAGIWQSADSAV